MIEQFKKRVEELAQQIAMSANIYNAKDNELKQHLANHNVIIGQHMEAQKALDALNAEKEQVPEADHEHA